MRLLTSPMIPSLGLHVARGDHRALMELLQEAQLPYSDHTQLKGQCHNHLMASIYFQNNLK